MKFNKRCNRYRVLRSDYAPMPVGMQLLNKQHELIAVWIFADDATGEVSEVVAEKIDAACPDCANLGYGRIADHDGEHGEAAPHLPPVGDPR